MIRPAGRKTLPPPAKAPFDAAQARANQDVNLTAEQLLNSAIHEWSTALLPSPSRLNQQSMAQGSSRRKITASFTIQRG